MDIIQINAFYRWNSNQKKVNICPDLWLHVFVQQSCSLLVFIDNAITCTHVTYSSWARNDIFIVTEQLLIRIQRGWFSCRWASGWCCRTSCRSCRRFGCCHRRCFSCCRCRLTTSTMTQRGDFQRGIFALCYTEFTATKAFYDLFSFNSTKISVWKNDFCSMHCIIKYISNYADSPIKTIVSLFIHISV